MSAEENFWTSIEEYLELLDKITASSKASVITKKLSKSARFYRIAKDAEAVLDSAEDRQAIDTTIENFHLEVKNAFVFEIVETLKDIYETHKLIWEYAGLSEEEVKEILSAMELALQQAEGAHKNATT
jgi:hypothetical protein